MSAFERIERMAPLPVWQGIAARMVSGERLTLAVVELDPGAVVAEHAHENEQLGLLLHGSMAFRVGDEEREFRANERAWEFFQAQPRSYRRPALWWVVSAKREETRARRLRTLIEDSASGRRLRHLSRPPRR